MDWMYERPWSLVLAGVGVITFVLGEVRGTRLVLRGLRNPDHPDQDVWLIRGVRAWIVGIALLAVGLGALFRAKWAVLFGLVFLGEELLEAFTYLSVIAASRKREAGRERGGQAG